MHACQPTFRHSLHLLSLALGAALGLSALATGAAAQAPAAPAPAAPPAAAAPPPAAEPAPAPAPAGAPPPGQYAAPPAQYPPPQYGAQPGQYGTAPPQYVPPPGYYPPPAYPAPVSRPPRPSKGLMITGIAVLGGSYLVSMLTGAILLDEESTATCIDCDEVGPLLFIPVLGPFIAMGPAVDGEGALALLGSIQVVGLGLMIGGIIRYVSTKRAAEQAGYYGWQLPEGRSLSLDVSTSQARLGPTLRLRF